MLESLSQELSDKLPELPESYQYTYTIGSDTDSPIVVVSIAHEDPETLLLMDIYSLALDMNIAYYITNPIEVEDVESTYPMYDFAGASITMVPSSKITDRVVQAFTHMDRCFEMFINLLQGIS